MIKSNNEDVLQSSTVVPAVSIKQEQQHHQQQQYPQIQSQSKEQEKYIRKAKKNMTKVRMKSAIKSEIRNFGRNRGNILSVLARKLEAAGSDTIRAANLTGSNNISKPTRGRVGEESTSIQLELSQITEDNQHQVHHMLPGLHKDTNIPETQKLQHYEQHQQQQYDLERISPTINKRSGNNSPRYENNNNHIHLVIPTFGPDVTDSPMVTPIATARLPRANNAVKHYMASQQILGKINFIGNDVDSKILKGEWSLIYTSSSFLFMSSPFFQAARYVCKTTEEIDRFKWFCRQHRDALAFTSIGSVKQIITDTTLTSEFESNVAAIPGLPVVIKGTIESKADVDFENNLMKMKMDTVRIKQGTSNIPFISNLLDEFDGLQTRILSDVLETNVDTYTTPVPEFRTYYCDDSFRISRDIDDDIYIYVKN